MTLCALYRCGMLKFDNPFSLSNNSEEVWRCAHHGTLVTISSKGTVCPVGVLEERIEETLEVAAKALVVLIK